MSLIDFCVIIDLSVRLVVDVQVGLWFIVGVEVEIGEGMVIGLYVVFKGFMKIGKYNCIYQFFSVGEDIFDLKYKGELMCLVIGDYNVICEGVIIYCGIVQDCVEIIIGDYNLIMVYVYIGYDSVIGNYCILVNNMVLVGYVYVDDWVILFGYILVYQYCWIGVYSFFGMGSVIGKDVLVYVMVFGNLVEVCSMNFEGMCWCGFSSEVIYVLWCVYKVVYCQGYIVEEVLVELVESVVQFFEVVVFCDFIQSVICGIIC